MAGLAGVGCAPGERRRLFQKTLGIGLSDTPEQAAQATGERGVALRQRLQPGLAVLGRLVKQAVELITDVHPRLPRVHFRAIVVAGFGRATRTSLQR